MKYLGLLRQNNFPEKGKSLNMQRKIAQYKGYETNLAKALAELETANEKRQAKLNSEIQVIKSTMADLDAELCTLIENYAKNQDKYKAVGQKMAAGRQAKGGKTPAEPAKPDPVPDPPKPVPQPDPAPTPVPVKAKEKSSSTSTWLFAGLALIGAVIGINIWQNRN
jgi:hypothetical protein